MSINPVWVNAVSANTMSVDTVSVNRVSVNAVSVNTVSVNTVSVNSESANTMSVRAVRLTRWIITGLLVAVCSVSATGTATAGGPTSALLVSPNEEHATALYHTDPDYTQLQQLLGESPVGQTSTTAPSAQTPSDYVTITWLIHDVEIWRIDRVFLPTSGDPLIVTQQSIGGDGMLPGEDGGAAAIHHRSSDPAALTSLLTELGLTRSAGSAPADQTATAVPAAAAAADTPADTAPAETMAGASTLTADGLSGATWLSLFVGLTIGIGGGALLLRYVPTARRRVLAVDAYRDQYDDDRPGDGRPGDGPVRMPKLPV